MIDKVLRELLKNVDAATDELVELHQSLVQIPTVNTGSPDSGNEIKACRFLESRFNAEGIANTVLESAPGRGNLVASIGQSNGPRLLLMSHLDVVPVEDEEAWQHPPFSGVVQDGKVYGRGSDDAKSLVASGAMALILLARAGVSLGGQVRFLAAADEEAGGRFGAGWLAENHPDEVRCDWAVNEGSGAPLEVGARPGYVLATGEKGRMEARFRLAGKSGHGAIPWQAENPIYKLPLLLDRLENYEAERDVSLPLFEHLHQFGVDARPTTASIDAVVAQLQPENPALANMLAALSQMTVTPTMISAGIKSNSIPGAVEVVCDIRTLPHQDEAYVRDQLQAIVKGIEGVEVTLDVTASANASPYDSPFVQQLQQATKVALGDDEIVWIPGLTVGFTDSRFIRSLGTDVYGFAPLAPGSDTVRPGVHGVDEMMEIENLVLRTKVNVALAYQLLAN